MERIKIKTGLRVALERFRNYPDSRQSQLQDFANNASQMLGRKAPLINLVAGGAVKFRNDGANINVDIGKEYIDNTVKWEQDVADNGIAAVFGTVARAIAKEFGSDFKKVQDSVAELIKMEPGWENPVPKQAILIEGMSESLAGFAVSRKNAAELRREMPGLGDAVAASFISTAIPDPEMFAPEGFKQDDLYKRWNIIWSALIMEMCDNPVPDEIYGDEDVKTLVQTAAEEIVNAKGEEDIANAAMYLLPLFNNEDGEPDFENTGDPEDQDIGHAQMMDVQDTATQAISYGGKLPPVPVDRPTDYILEKPQPGKPIKESELEGDLREWLTDSRMEHVTGQMSGDLRQVARIMSDQRVFSKRRMVSDPVDAVVVICVDASGSMRGAESQSAIAIHDAMCLALRRLEIPVYSCAYLGGSYGEVVIPVNTPTSMPSSADPAGQGRGGNADDAALTWATGIIEDFDAEKSVIVFLADGQFGNTTVATFKRRVKDLNVNVFHVDYINSPVSPFGGKSIHARGKSIKEISEPLARGMAEVLELVS